MKKQNIIIVFTIVLISFFSIKISAQENTEKKEGCSNKSCCNSTDKMAMNDSTKMMHNNHKMMKDHKKMNDSTSMHGMMHKKGHEMNEEKSSIVREGIIDLSAIDMNKDGKVYQDQMCWNIISDVAGKCPQCNMKLKEVSLEHAKNKLVENGYKTKD